MVLGTALLILTGCPETPADQSDTSDTTAPDPIIITSANITAGMSSVTLQWDPSPSNDVAEVQVTWTPEDGEDQPKVIAIDSTNTTIAGLHAGTPYAFSITAIDTAGNESSVVEITAATIDPDTTAPEPVTTLSAAPASGTAVTLTWANSTSDDVAMVRITWTTADSSDEGSAEITDGSTMATITELESETEYTFTLTVLDGAGNESTTQTIPVTTADITGPSPVTNPMVTATSGTAVTLTWIDSISDDAATVRISWIADGSSDAAGSTEVNHAVQTADITGLTSETGYTVTLTVVDDAGNVSSAPTVVPVTTADITDPAEVTAQSATATSGTAVTLTWIDSASDDAATVHITWTNDGDTGTAGVRIDRGTQTAIITELESETEYTFTLVAEDAAGNRSGAVTADATTPDIDAPSSVSSFSATPLASGTEVELRWTNSDSVDAATLEIAWTSSTNGVAPGSKTIPSGTGMGMHTVSGLIPSTPYTFTITVIDTADNRSDTETAGPITTPANPVDTDGDTLIDISSLAQLHNMRYNLDGTSYKTSSNGSGALCGADAATTCTGYELTQNLDFDRDSDDRTYNASSYALDSGDNHATYFPVSGGSGGWMPIGDATNPFSTIFEGNDFSIRSLAIRRNQTYVGMFGRTDSSAIIRNIRLNNNLADYTGSSGSNTYVGGLVAYNAGTISDSRSRGPADGDSGGNDRVGGLVGLNDNTGTITTSHATGTADGGGGGDNDRVGGLVGRNNGTITDSYATGDVVGNNDHIGGLVGFNTGTIAASYATGDADGGGSTDHIGGLVGQNNSTIIASYATGDADGGGSDDRVGGLVGHNTSAGTIIASYATGAIDGEGGSTDRVGGLVGQNDGTITASYATGAANSVGNGGYDDVGGLAGNNSGTIIASYATGKADGGNATDDSVGGLAGENSGTIIASYSTGDAEGGSGFGDYVGALVGWNDEIQGGTITGSYGFGGTMGGRYTGPESSGDLDPDSIGAGNNPHIAGARRLVPAGHSSFRAVTVHWNQASSNTQNAWDFGTDSQAVALRYADYDGDGNTYGCGSNSTATIVIPARVPNGSGGSTSVSCGSTLLGGQPR